MADNTTLNAGTGGDTIASDDIGGVKFQRVKPAIGADGTATDAVPVSNGMDVTGAAVQAVGIVGQFDDVSTGTVTENQFAPVRISTRRALLVEGVASGTAVPVSAASIPLPSGAATLAEQQTQSTSLAAAVTALQILDNVVSGSEAQVDVVAALPAGDNNIGNVDIVTMPAVTNAGTFAVQVDGAALTALQLIDDSIVQDDTAFTPGTTKTTVAGFQADETATDSVDEGDAGAARMTLDRKQIVTLQPHTAGGLSTFMASGSDGSSILVATAQAIKASAGQLYGYYAYNPEAAVTFVHFYNTAAASVTVGTTTPLFTIAIPAGSAANLSIPQGITFSNAGWSCAATTTAGGNTAPSTGVSLVVWYM